LLTDPNRLRQCLINLINNAIKFTEEGHVYVNVSMEDEGNQPYICFAVEDTGIGIPGDKQDKIFEEFAQADGSDTRKFGGTGLGLSITKNLVELIGGSLRLTSEVGKGSVFSLVMPLGMDVEQSALDMNDLADTSDTPAKTEQINFSGGVLVAEDNPSNQVLLKHLLEKKGLEVTIVGDGKIAVDECRARSFDLIFMDMQMPNMNGYEATRALRKQGVETPIIACTANAMKGDDKKCIDAGCDGYIAKPIGLKELQKILTDYLPVGNETLREQVNSV